MAASHDGGRLSTRLRTALSARLSPERTRRTTTFERLTVARLSWDQVVRLNRWLELLGKLTTWRLQRELWRRDVARLEQPGGS